MRVRLNRDVQDVGSAGDVVDVPDSNHAYRLLATHAAMQLPPHTPVTVELDHLQVAQLLAVSS